VNTTENGSRIEPNYLLFAVYSLPPLILPAAGRQLDEQYLMIYRKFGSAPIQKRASMWLLVETD
jgi:hypothetical protein